MSPGGPSNRRKHSENLLTISSLNINGLECKNNGIKSNKLYDQDVIDNLSKFDFIGLVETHADSNTDISLKGIMFFEKTGRETKSMECIGRNSCSSKRDSKKCMQI